MLVECHVCKGCGVPYPLHVKFFHRDKSRKSGFFPRCRDCHRNVRKSLSFEPLYDGSMKQCHGCKFDLPRNTDCYVRDRSCPDGLRIYCRVCLFRQRILRQGK